MSLALCSLCRFPTAVRDFLINVQRNVMRGRDIEMYPWWLATVQLNKAFPLHISKWDTGQNKISKFTPNKFFIEDVLFCFNDTSVCPSVTAQTLRDVGPFNRSFYWLFLSLFSKLIKYMLENLLSEASPQKLFFMCSLLC